MGFLFSRDVFALYQSILEAQSTLRQHDFFCVHISLLLTPLPSILKLSVGVRICGMWLGDNLL